MIRGTTPTFKLIINDQSVDLTQASNVYATFKQNSVTITKTGEDLEVSANEVDVYLSQEESLSFTSNSFGVCEIKCQLNWTYTGGMRASTKIVKIPLTENLVNEVLE